MVGVLLREALLGAALRRVHVSEPPRQHAQGVGIVGQPVLRQVRHDADAALEAQKEAIGQLQVHGALRPQRTILLQQL